MNNSKKFFMALAMVVIGTIISYLPIGSAPFFFIPMIMVLGGVLVAWNEAGKFLEDRASKEVKT